MPRVRTPFLWHDPDHAGGLRPDSAIAMDNVELLSSFLKRATRTLHSSVEAEVAIDRRLASSAEYVQLLKRLYGIHKPFEDILGAKKEIVEAYVPDVGERFKVHLLEQDLHFLKAGSPTNAEVCSLAEVEGIPEIFGAFYVLEGSTIGGNMIAQSVHRHLGYGPGKGTSFYSSYGKDVGRRWNVFKSHLDRLETNGPFSREAVLDGATRMFRIFGEWFRR
jgi:heme oxygenase (biliverdin-IX-beta and delta-forming)